MKALRITSYNVCYTKLLRIAYRLLIKDSIEEKIRRLQKKKQALAEDVLGEEKFAQSLTLEDLRYLFAD